MKKILIILLACFYITDVSALTYSDYGDFTDFQEEKIESDDLTDVKVERRYKYYKLKKELGPYEEAYKVNDNYKEISYEDYIYTEESEYLDEKPDEKEGRIITEDNVYKYKKAFDINHVDIFNLNYNNINIIVNNLKVFYKGEPIDYQISYNKGNDNTINGRGTMSISFDKKLVLKDLAVSFDVISANGNTSFYLETRSDDTKISFTQYASNNTQITNINWEGKYLDLYDNTYEYYYTKTKEQSCSTYLYIGQIKAYTYKDTLYRKYNIIKDYYDDYLKEPYQDYIYKDEEYYKDYYAKRTRSILENKEPFKEKTKENKIEELFQSKNLSNNVFPQTMIHKNDNNHQINNFQTYKTIKQKENKNVTKPPIMEYFSYILILFIFLILVLSKLYKKRK